MKNTSIESLTISIAFEEPNGRYSDGTIARVSNVSDLAAEENRNHIFYDTEDPFQNTSVELLKEHYEEAVKLASASPIQNPAIHQTTPLEEAIDEVLPAFAAEMRAKHGLKCSAIGEKIDTHVEDIGVNFTVVQRADQEEARQWIVLATESLLATLNP